MDESRDIQTLPSKPLVSRKGLTNGNKNVFDTTTNSPVRNGKKRNRKLLLACALTGIGLIVCSMALQYAFVLPGGQSADRTGSGGFTVGARNTINVDGDPSDWTGTLPAQSHEVAISNGEWLYKGNVNDERKDLSGSSNNDITEVRVTANPSNIYFLVKMRDITDINLVHVSISIDTDHNTADGGMNWLGDESGITHTAPENYGERNIDIRCASTDTPVIEMYADDGTNWYAPPTSPAVSISAANDVVEASVAREDIGNPSVIWITIATEKNVVGWNNLVDTTESNSVCDGVDVVAGVPGSTVNAWERGLSAGHVNNTYKIVLGSDGAIPEFSDFVVPVVGAAVIIAVAIRRK